ncbi:50S ribosomal protein L6 [Spirochaeta cellobiosiphila]|uniref:50S ribosomal protein L6 n=1 Tax=Spirochaeta cellobiosiphila TaxID=504483 RepID=UPI000425A2FF|nr:50S ribosomal protein L6 [Spirochaeta cellobiosiphila]
MSRIGKKPIELPQGVKVTFGDNLFTVEGPKGKLSQDYKPHVTFAQEGNVVTVNRVDDSKPSRSYHGLYRNLLANMVEGVSKGFTKNLVINGVGYRAETKGNIVTFNLGYSTQIEYVVPEGVEVKIDSNTKVAVLGIDKQKVGQVAAEIRGLRPPEPYKGKGIKYEEEHIRRKVGKSGVK